MHAQKPFWITYKSLSAIVLLPACNFALVTLVSDVLSTKVQHTSTRASQKI